MTDAFRRFWQLGYRQLIPIIPPAAEISERSTLYRRIGTKQDGRGKTPGTRGRDGLWSSFPWADYQTDESDLDRWAAMGAGVGIRTGELIGIDADTLKPDLAVVIRDAIEARFGRLPIRVGRSPKALYVLRLSEPMPYARIEFGDERVEVLTDGKQFVAEGVHPVTGKPYTWPRGVPAYADIPVASPADALALLEDLRAKLPAASKVITEGGGSDTSQASLRAPLEVVRKAVQAIPNTSNHFPSRESYVQLGYAIKAALPDDEPAAFELFSEWCSRWTDGVNEPDVIEADWRRMKPPFKRGAGWLINLAAERSDTIAWFEPIADEPEALWPIEEAATPARTLYFTSLQDAAASALSASTKPLVKGLLDQGTLSVMYGPSNVGKTFCAMDIFFHISAGLAWGGMRTERGLVVYVAAEGGAGARKRADALCKRYGVESASVDFQMLLSPVDLLRADADLGPLIAAIKGLGRPALAVGLDTLSRIMAGGEENSSVDMGTLVKHVDRIRKETGAHVMLVHHSGKDQAKGARGHSLLRAATDTEIEIAEGQIAVTKQRDLDKAFSTAFSLNVVTLGVDADGEPVTSCTVDLAPRIVSSAPLTPTEQSVYEALNVVLSSARDGAKGVRAADVADYLQEAGSDNMSSETVRTHLKNMAKKHAVVCPMRGFWAPKAELPLSIREVFQTIEPEESGRQSGRSVFD